MAASITGVGHATDIEFDADGVTLRGWLYQPAGPGPHPLVVMAHGFSAVKEMGLDDYAAVVCAAGLAVLPTITAILAPVAASRARRSTRLRNAAISIKNGARWVQVCTDDAARPAAPAGAPQLGLFQSLPQQRARGVEQQHHGAFT